MAMKKKKSSLLKSLTIKVTLVVLILGFAGGGTLALWAVTLPLPDFDTFFHEQQITESTKIYDRTGQVLLYDVHGDVRRTVIPFEKISPHAKRATIAIEDANFYQHSGIKPSSIARAFIVNMTHGQIKQGGSTITQQVIKNVLLVNDRRFSRKLKELVLAPKLERHLTKDEILSLYLNAIPYGGSIYGIEEASQTFFKKSAGDLTIAEAAYLAALPQAPTFFSPYGNNKERLVERKNLVLRRMHELNFIDETEYKQAQEERVAFSRPENRGIKAPHFVFYVLSHMEQKYGREIMENKGYRVITTLDWELQQKAQDIVRRHGDQNATLHNARNAGLVAIDPKNGQILAMVGSRNYFDIENEGNFNVTLAKRQPGSAFKPFVYAAAFNKGFTPETVVFDLPTEFDVGCSVDSVPLRAGARCYNPSNYDGTFSGPMTFRTALAQSKNIPAIKVLYLTGVNESIRVARDFGITTLTDATRYGLTLVLGGGEVTLLEMASAYGAFANDGVRNPHEKILKVQDRRGRVLEEFSPKSTQVIPANVARIISNILSDNVARTPVFGANSALNIPGYQVAAKTGTTNNYRDAWIVGYTPNLVVGAWVGNNDNRSMDQKIAGMIVAPLWNAFMREALVKLPTEQFIPPEPTPSDLRPIHRGIWQGNDVAVIDRATGQSGNYNVHSILYWVDKNNPQGPAPSNPGRDPQFRLWETPVLRWAAQNGYSNYQPPPVKPPDPGGDPGQEQPTNPETQLIIIAPTENQLFNLDDQVILQFILGPTRPINQANIYLNGRLIHTLSDQTNSFSILPRQYDNVREINELRVVVIDKERNRWESTRRFNLNLPG
jgi:1A family penicillin-binding protein